MIALGTIKGEAPRAMEATASSRSLSTTLRAVAFEIGDLAQLADRLQPLISAALMADGLASPDHMREFQAIDLLVQRLHGVAAFTDALAGVTANDWRVDAAAAAAHVPLSDLARRLSGGELSAGEAEHTRVPPTGDLDLFG